MKDGSTGMLEAKYHRSVEVVLQFVSSFVDHSTIHGEHAYLKDIKRSYSHRLNRIGDASDLSSWMDTDIDDFLKDMKPFKTTSF